MVRGREVTAHVPNSGRLSELFISGCPALLAPAPRHYRKTPFDLLLVQSSKLWVSVDSRLPPRLLEEAVLEGRLPEFQGYEEIQREVEYGGSRLDLILRGKAKPWLLVEVKSVTLVQEGTGYFPDAVTERGRRHLEVLVRARKRGRKAAVVFVVQREDAVRFSPHHASDPLFGQALVQAVERGVEVYAYRCRVSPQEISISGRIPVVLDGNRGVSAANSTIFY